LIVVLCCVFVRHIRRPEPLLLMLIVAWSTVDGFEQPRLKIIVVSSLFTSFFSSVSTFGPVDCHVPSSSHRLDYQSNRIEVERGWLSHSPHPISHHMLCRSTSSPTIIDRPRLCFVHRGCFVGPSIKWTASVATEAAKGVWGVLGGALVAIVRRFGGHRTWFRWLSCA
jgi:hypothetical protein